MSNILQSDEDEFAKFKEENPLPVPEGITLPALPHQPNSVESDEFQEFESYQASQPEEKSTEEPCGHTEPGRIPHSSTNDSLVEVTAKNGVAASVTSSGYGSQAVSIQTLSSEDSGSVRSMSIDDTPEQDLKKESNSKPSSDKGDQSSDSKSDGKQGRGVLTSSDSLIDSDIPSNLNSPIKPEHPTSGETEHAGSENKPSVKEKDIVTKPVNHLNGSKKKEKSKKSRLKRIKEPVVDVYSENAMEELERLGDSDDEIDDEQSCEDSYEEETADEASDRDLRPIKSTTNLLDEEQISEGPVSVPKDSDRVQVPMVEVTKSDYDNHKTESDTNGNQQTPVKNNNVGVTKSGSLKKLRNTEGRSPRAGPSPMRATYRPASMYEMPTSSSMEAIDKQIEQGKRVALIICILNKILLIVGNNEKFNMLKVCLLLVM